MAAHEGFERRVVASLDEAAQKVAIRKRRIVAEQNKAAKMLDQEVVCANRHGIPVETGLYKSIPRSRGC